MKKVVFIAHDPGSCDVLHPVFKEIESRSIFLVIGPSVAKYPMNEIGEETLEDVLQQMVAEDSLAGIVIGRDWGTDLDVRILYWARQHKVKSIVILDYWSNYASSFCDSGKYYWPDTYCVMDELAKQEAIAEGVPFNVLKIVGHPGLDKFYTRGRGDSQPGKDILFLSQPLSLLYGDTLGYTEQSTLADVFAACQACGRKIDVKFHPKDDLRFQQRYQDIAVNGDVDELMKHYRLVIGMTTIALLHAVLMQVPIISYQPGLKVKDGCITNRLGLSRLVDEYSGLLAVLSSGATIKVKENGGHIWLDGHSAKRAAKIVMEMMG